MWLSAAADVALLFAGCGGGEPALEPAASSWERLPDAPIDPRTEAAVGWTGREIVVVGGNDFVCGANDDCGLGDATGRSDGAAFEPATQTWRPTADAPFPVWSATTVQVGDWLFLLAVTDPRTPDRALLRYDGIADDWAVIDPPVPLSDAPWRLAATDSALLLYPGSDELGPYSDWLLDPDSGEWTTLADDPQGPGFGRTYLWADGDLYLFDHELVPQPGGADGPSFLRATRLRNGDWTTLPTSDALGGGLPLVADERIIFPALGCSDGGEVNGYGRCIPRGGVFNTELETWSELPDAPGRGNKDVFSSGAISSEAAVVWAAGHPYLDANTNTWLRAPSLDGSTDATTQRWVHGVGPHAFVFGGARFSDSSASGELLNDAWLWSPLN
jgi:hypothetical protein